MEKKDVVEGIIKTAKLITNAGVGIGIGALAIVAKDKMKVITDANIDKKFEDIAEVISKISKIKNKKA